MRIAIVGPFPPFRGGIADLNSALAYHLSKMHEVHAFNFTTQYPKAFFPGKTQYKSGGAAQDFHRRYFFPVKHSIKAVVPLRTFKISDV